MNLFEKKTSIEARYQELKGQQQMIQVELHRLEGEFRLIEGLLVEAQQPPALEAAAPVNLLAPKKPWPPEWMEPTDEELQAIAQEQMADEPGTLVLE